MQILFSLVAVALLASSATAAAAPAVNFVAALPDVGTSGMPRRSQFAAIRKAGYEVVVNLAPYHVLGAHRDEAELVTAQAMSYHYIPIDFARPTAGDVAEFIRVMKDNRGKRVYVHCQVNMRASVFVFLYRVTELGEDVDRAYADVQRIWQPHGVWRALIIEVLAARNLKPPLALG